MKKYCILGTDSRSIKLKELYIEENKQLGNIFKGDYIIAPIPFSRDNKNINGEILTIDEMLNIPDIKNKILFTGSISAVVKEKLDKAKIKYYDLMMLDEVAILNAIPTAEGAIATAMEMTDFNLCNSNVLVMGYGRIGKVLSKMLDGLGCKVYVEARKEKDLALARAMGISVIDLKDLDENLNKFQIIFNTIPELILNKQKLDLINKKCSIIDLASNPGGVDFTYAKDIGINVIWALALPSKVAPLSSAVYIKEAIDKVIKKTEDVINDCRCEDYS